MAVMQSLSERAERLLVLVETSYGSGDFQVDPRLRAEEVWQRSDTNVSRARIAVQVTDAVDGEEIRRLYHPDRRVAICTEDPDPLARAFLFEGYPPVQVSRWDGRVGREGEAYVFEAEHVWERFSRARQAAVYGRRMRSGLIEDGLVSEPQAYASASEHYTVQPCIFNPDSEANRAVEPLRIVRPGESDRLVHIFAPDGAAGVKWTYAAALRYLVWFHLMTEGPVFEGNIFDATNDLVAGVPGEATAMRAMLERECESLNCEATSLTEALGLLGAAAGVHVTAETVNVAGRPKTQLRVWSCRDGAARKLYLVRGGHYGDGVPMYDTSTRSVSEILRDNNTYRGDVTWDHRRIANHAVVLGGVKRYEVTVPLVPGWQPTACLDNVEPADRTACKIQALTPDDVKTLGELVLFYEWYRRYHRDGPEHFAHADVGRLWVLNEDGAFDGATYNRHAPFDAYGPFDLTGAIAADEMPAGGWLRRPRTLEKALSVGSDGRSLGVVVEVSFDSGVTWSVPSGRIEVLEDRAGILFACDNPTQIVPPGVLPGSNNMWYALIDQAFRVRVTAVIEGDDRLTARFGPEGLASPTMQVNTVLVRRPSALLFASRSRGSSLLYPDYEAGEDERDDSVAAESLAEWLARTRQDRQVRVSPAIPWIETGYGIGDRITEIAGRCVRFATTVGAEAGYPAVTERRYVLQDGRYETILTLSATELPEGVL